ncbi:MAG TPA: hypothetical protein VN855_00455 [Candidatus Acidoferrum sp.]|nr:hypothetical protein [Candidatus Acidoferrum sp.]
MNFLCYLLGHKFYKFEPHGILPEYVKVDLISCDRCGEGKHRPPASPWREVPGDMYRIEVPGGWIYTDSIPGHSIAMCFVPYPKDNK